MRLAASLRAGELTELSSGSLCDILLPATSCFLLNASYVKHNTLVDAAVEVVGAICGRLPWRSYEAVLTRYLRQLQHNSEHHKTIIRLIVGILDAFHFDLAKSRGVGKGAKPEVKSVAQPIQAETNQSKADDAISSDAQKADGCEEIASDDEALDAIEVEGSLLKFIFVPILTCDSNAIVFL